MLAIILKNQDGQLTPFQLSCAMMTLSRHTSATFSERSRVAHVLAPHLAEYFSNSEQEVDEIGLRNITIAIGRLNLNDSSILSPLSDRIVAAAPELNFASARSLL